MTERGDTLRLEIRAKAQWFMTAFVAFWLIAWAFGWVMAFGALVSGGAGAGAIFMAAWLGLWTIGGLWAISFVLWNLAGREIIDISPQTLTAIRQIPGWSRETVCDLTRVSGLTVTAAEQTSFFTQWHTMPGPFRAKSAGTLNVTYGVHTIGFGQELDPAEAKRAAALILDRFPQLAK